MVVFAPIDLVVTLATGAATDVAEKSDVLSKIVWTGGTALGVAGTALSLVFFAGVIDRIVAVDQKGEDDLPIRASPPTTSPRCAWSLAAVLTAVFTDRRPDPLPRARASSCMVLFCVVGPIVVIEGAERLAAAFERSAALVGPHFFLALVTVIDPAHVRRGGLHVVAGALRAGTSASLRASACGCRRRRWSSAALVGVLEVTWRTR